jgi:hypothetical protein
VIARLRIFEPRRSFLGILDLRQVTAPGEVTQGSQPRFALVFESSGSANGLSLFAGRGRSCSRESRTGAAYLLR